MSQELVKRSAQAQLMECLTVSSKQLIDVKYDWNFITGQDRLRYWKCPNSVTHEQHNQILQDLERIGDAYATPSKEWLGGRIASLLALYFVANANEALNTSVALEWLEALQHLPQDCINRACGKWRDTEGRKPKPADIRQSAKRIAGDDFIAYERLKELACVPVEEDEKFQCKECRDTGSTGHGDLCVYCGFGK